MHVQEDRSMDPDVRYVKLESCVDPLSPPSGTHHYVWIRFTTALWFFATGFSLKNLYVGRKKLKIMGSFCLLVLFEVFLSA
jgi:hypothetical protein